MVPFARHHFNRTPVSRALACILDGITAALLWPRRNDRYWLTDSGRRAIHPDQWIGREISLDDWARMPSCGLCGNYSALSLPHATCVAVEAWIHSGAGVA